MTDQSYSIDAKTKELKKSKGFEQIPYGNSLVSAEHLAKIAAKSSKKSESSLISALGLSDTREKKQTAK